MFALFFQSIADTFFCSESNNTDCKDLGCNNFLTVGSPPVLAFPNLCEQTVSHILTNTFVRDGCSGCGNLMFDESLLLSLICVEKCPPPSPPRLEPR